MHKWVLKAISEPVEEEHHNYYMYYKAYGLSIKSELIFPELKPSCIKEDISIIFDTFDSSLFFDEYDYGFFKVRRSINGLFVIIDNRNICWINSGNQIVINPDHGVDEGYLRVLILGPILSFLLHQKGYLILHGSAININGGAIALLGDNGAGKSTTMFALQKRGYESITDDILTIKFDEKDEPWVFPSFPRLKLCPDIMDLMDEDIDKFSKTFKESTKYSYPVKNFYEPKLPLKKIYLLEKGDNCSLTTLNKNEYLIKIIESSYCYGIFSTSDIIKNMKISSYFL